VGREEHGEPAFHRDTRRKRGSQGAPAAFHREGDSFDGRSRVAGGRPSSTRPLASSRIRTSSARSRWCSGSPATHPSARRSAHPAHGTHRSPQYPRSRRRAARHWS